MLYIVILKRKRDDDENIIENERIFKIVKAVLTIILLTRIDDGNNLTIPTPFTY